MRAGEEQSKILFMPYTIYCIVACSMLLAIGIAQTARDRQSWYMLMAGVAAVVVSILGVLTRNSLFYKILMGLSLALSILAITNIILLIKAEKFEVTFGKDFCDQ
ncbi:hypothetical protein OESDEN_01886 [Oesophagostomum dentatum]|uniref:Uncharacterized protein n=1 Tax=Oesophagostomum dentatum TaxID=61180 RepID=A0A0B1TKV4_OESDE|nr:hypothetical protein OESDEN_01886 [Oesophagostomum dentatum]